MAAMEQDFLEPRSISGGYQEMQHRSGRTRVTYAAGKKSKFRVYRATDKGWDAVSEYDYLEHACRIANALAGF